MIYKNTLGLCKWKCASNTD